MVSLSVSSFVSLMFSPPIINDYINQLEALKRYGKENSKESKDIMDKLYDIEIRRFDLNINIDINNSWLLNCIGDYYEKVNDYIKAFEWYIKSINLGNSNAMFNLGCYYKNIEKDYPNTIEWFIKSADLGNTFAMNNLGYYYDEIEKDHPKACEWYMKSINLGNTNIIYNLANIIDKQDYNFIFDLMMKCNDEGTENKQIKNILLDKLPKDYILNKQQEIINSLKSVKNQGIDKVLINSILKHF